MIKILTKTIIGLILGTVFCSYAKNEVPLSLSTVCLFLLWGIGLVYGFRFYLRWLGSVIQSAMQLSIISALSFGTGIIGFILLMFASAVILAFGWIYGCYLLIRDIVSSI